jgi:membrane protease YdiL (CAAX protease family)
MRQRSRSQLTKLDVVFGVVAAIITFYFAIKYIPSTDSYAHQFGIMNLMEGMFALSGILFINIVEYGEFNITDYEAMSPWTFPRYVIIFITIMLIQLLAKVPLRVRTIEVAFSVAMAAICEELFFRGLLVGAVDNLEGTLGFKVDIFGKDMNALEFIGILMVALFFMLIHTNYYDTPVLLLVAFLSGLALNLYYWRWKDLTANILAHFTLNMLAVINMVVSNLCLI